MKVQGNLTQVTGTGVDVVGYVPVRDDLTVGNGAAVVVGSGSTLDVWENVLANGTITNSGTMIANTNRVTNSQNVHGQVTNGH